jgi:plasmid stability protein
VSPNDFDPFFLLSSPPQSPSDRDVDFGSLFPHTVESEDEIVATLNLKNVPDPIYRKLRARAKRKGRSVAQEAVQILAQATEEPAPLSILALKGLGKELWCGVDAAAYVAEERRSWD